MSRQQGSSQFTLPGTTGLVIVRPDDDGFNATFLVQTKRAKFRLRVAELEMGDFQFDSIERKPIRGKLVITAVKEDNEVNYTARLMGHTTYIFGMRILKKGQSWLIGPFRTF